MKSDNSFQSTGGVAVDPVSGKIFVSDSNAGRVLRFSSTEAAVSGGSAEAVFGQPNLDSLVPGPGVSAMTMKFPRGLCVDGVGNLYVADTGNNRVLRFATAASLPSGSPATSVIGQPNMTSNAGGSFNGDLAAPYTVRVDVSGRVWVADSANSRIVRFDVPAAWTNGPNSSFTLSGPQNNGLSVPKGLWVSGDGSSGKPWIVWVADSGKNRVLRFYNPSSLQSAPDKVLGQDDMGGTQASNGPARFSNPTSVAVDAGGRLFVGDQNHNRVLRFENPNNALNGAGSAGVLGQDDFFAFGAGTAAHKMNQPLDLFPGGDTLFVADYENRRVLRFVNAYALSDGSNPTTVLGMHANGGTTNVSAGVIGSGKALAVDPVSGKLYVADQMWHRVLRYSSVAALTAGAQPEMAFGQMNTGTATPGLGANKLQFPAGVAVDAAGRLWVADLGNGRVLRFDNAAGAESGASASGVLGQPDFNSTSIAAAANRLSGPSGLCVDAAGRLWVADAGNHRVLRFDNAAAKSNGAPADGVLGQAVFTTLNQFTTSTGMRSPTGVAVSADGRLYVADRSNNRILRFDSAATKSNGAAANFVYGQSDFITADPSQTRLTLPEKVVINPMDDSLWIADTGNSRAAGWKKPLNAGLGASPDVVLGQDSIQGTLALDNSLRHTVNPSAVAFDGAGRLWVADTGNKRVVRFSPPPVPVTISFFAQQKILLTIDTESGHTYEVWTSTNLLNWSKQGNPVTGIAGSIIWTDQLPLLPRKFYKVIEP